MPFAHERMHPTCVRVFQILNMKGNVKLSVCVSSLPFNSNKEYFPEVRTRNRRGIKSPLGTHVINHFFF